MKILKFCFIANLILFLSSCHMLYLPNQVNAPVLSAENDFSANASVGFSNVNLQAAYSPVNNFGLMLNYAGGETSYETPSLNSSSYNFLEIGLGYYKPITNYLLFDIYGGFGKGNAYTYFADSYNNPTVKGDYTRLFIQPSLTLSASDFFDANFCLRPVLVNMQKSSTTISNYNTVFVEPVITLKYGWRYVKIINQFGISLPTTYFDAYEYNPFLLSFGLSFQLKSAWFKKNKTGPLE